VRRLLLLVCAVVLVDMVFYAAITPLLPYYSDRLGLSKTAAGVLTGAYPAGTLIGSLPAGWFAARVGVKPAVLLGLALLALSSVVFGLADSAALLDAARFVQGVGGAASWAGAFAWLIARAPAERRGEVLGTAFSAALAGALMGPLLGAIARGVGTEEAFGAIAVLAVSLMAWSAREPVPISAAEERLGLAAALRSPTVVTGMAGVVLVSLFFGVVDVLVPLRLDELGAGAVVVGGTFIAAAAAEGTAGPLVGRLTDRRGAALPIRVSLLSGMIMAILLPLPTVPWLLVGLLVLAALLVGGGLWVPSLSLLSEGAERAGAAQGYAFALMNLAWAASMTVGAAGGGGVADAVGDGAAYAGLAVVCAAGFAFFVRRQASVARLPA
jgi:MFS family permease